MNVADGIDKALEPLFEKLPLKRAMGQLVVTEGASPELIQTVEQVLQHNALAHRPELAAGLWLYVDELDRSHRISQDMPSPTGSFWHGIMHRREGDFSNSHYWFRKVGEHAAFSKIGMAGGPAGSGTTVGEYDPHNFIDRVERAHTEGITAPDLVAMQRHEWMSLFEWCARQAVLV